MPRARDHMGRFLAKTPSSYKVGTSNEEKKREDIGAKVQIYCWNKISLLEKEHTSDSLEDQTI